MENNKKNHVSMEDSPVVLPSLIKAIASDKVAVFDSIKKLDDVNDGFKSNGHPPISLSVVIEEADVKGQNDFSEMQRRTRSVSTSLPSSPIEAHLQDTKKVLFRDNFGKNFCTDIPNSEDTFHEESDQGRKTRFYSQPMTKGSPFNVALPSGKSPKRTELSPRNHVIDRLKDNRYDSFKTWSGKLERQLSNLRGMPWESELDSEIPKPAEVETLPVDRYFDALEGPELDTLRASEEILLPEDKQWPFLLRFPVSSFGICLGVGSQAIMWKTLGTSSSTEFLQVSPYINLVLWCISLALMAIVSVIYGLKVIFYFEAVRREYYHPIRVNFFFAPWIALLFLALGVPPSVSENLPPSLWYVLMTPILCLEVKIYGQWMSGGQRRLSKVANPSNHLSVVGNFVGALLGASMGLKEGPIFFFAVGLAHYIVLFVTLYQRLPTNETLPKELHPVFFLFVAAPSVASMAWARIHGSFSYGSQIAYFVALFLYFSLAVRVNFFRGFRFSLSWWAYTFPMTGAAIATIRYSNEVTNPVTKSLTVVLCAVSALTVSALLVTTIIQAFVLGNLFPNDMAIAISERRPKSRKWYHRRAGSSVTTKDIDQYLKYTDSDGKDIEASLTTASSNNQEVSSSVLKDVKNKYSQIMPLP
ncbi:S-type anion channel SLAH2-like [Olea europaea var. sylvestris]|uniref:S-type anion channel SLAH2-like n=1 Tax=Olea europaea var. sylvestris TaxID=158386 RepID=UPI000C1CEAA7|nr:S-type anion channel SLAH2-like [Olea europaea var. sylvestris]